MGNRMIPHHLENRGGERWGSGDISRPSPLPHYPTPKGVVWWWGNVGWFWSLPRGGEILACLTVIFPGQCFAGGVL